LYLSCFSLPLVALGLGLGLIIRGFYPREPVPPRPQSWGACAVTVTVIALVLVGFEVPRRVVFALCRAEFATLVDGAPVGGFGGEDMQRQLGPYWVDRYGAAPRGGVYFRTNTGPDGIGPDTMSYGFAYRPNRTGTPFGNTRYALPRLF